MPATAGLAAPAGVDDARHKPSDRAVFFASDGLRQDLVRRYAAQGVMPTMRDLLRKGVAASGNGLLTQAPPNTGAGWYTLATGAWPAVHGSTNNTFHVFASGTDVLQPGDDLLQVAIDWVSAHSPVDPVVEGRIVGP